MKNAFKAINLESLLYLKPYSLEVSCSFVVLQFNLVFTVGGFYQQKTSVSEYGTHLWEETSGSLIDTIDCEFRAPFGVGSATTKRLCLPGVSGLNQTTANV